MKKIKRKFKEFLLKITVKLFKRLYKDQNLKHSLQIRLFEEIKDSYQEVVKATFFIKKEIVQVKKGHVKYHMLYIWKDGKKIKVQISRHQSEKKPKEIII